MIQEERYRDMVKAVIAGGEMTEKDIVLRAMATECDRLREKIIDDAKELAELWLKYATKVEENRAAEPPYRYSIHGDVVENAAVFRARVRMLFDAVRLAYGEEGVKKFREAGAEC
jgi:hypothetical protein